MTIDKITERIYAFRFPDKEDNELSQLFEQWNDVGFLHDFFTQNFQDLAYFKVISVADAIDDTIEDADVLEGIFFESDGPVDFDVVFNPLHNQEYKEISLGKTKAKRNNRHKHAGWLRIYALKVDENLYVITGGAIKLTHLMESKPHTVEELRKMDLCRDFLKNMGVFDSESFNDYIKE